MVTSAAEAETDGVYQNARVTISLMHLLIEMGHPQLPIPIKRDNSTAAGFANGNIQLKRSKTWDMTLHWLRDPHNNKKLMFSGTEVTKMMRTTSPNTILHPTTANVDQLMYMIPSKVYRKTLILFITIEIIELRGYVGPTQTHPCTGTLTLVRTLVRA